MLTKRDFEAIAAAVRRDQPTKGNMKLGYHLAITAMANGLAANNPKFNRARFIQACCTPGDPPPSQEQLALLVLEHELSAA